LDLAVVPEARDLWPWRSPLRNELADRARPNILFWDISKRFYLQAAYNFRSASMPRFSRSPRQARLQELLISGRAAAGLTQEELARRLRRPQSFVSKYETGERRLDVVELLEIAEAIEVDLSALIVDLTKLQQS
jgi:hypothetical protein